MADIGASAETASLIRVRGLVQGVGFRPTVWRLAARHALRGWVANDGQGATIHACGTAADVDRFIQSLRREAPPLARIETIEREPAALLNRDAGFQIVASRIDGVRTGVAPDAASCRACIDEIFDPLSRRYRYPFTNCSHCGPRLSIIEAIPYDRATTTMRGFAMCASCRAEYEDPADRRFHAQPIACPACGPRAWLERADGSPLDDQLSLADAVDAACTVLERGDIVAVKGMGGFQLACDAADEPTVARLRRLKRREAKPFALMAADIATIRRHCNVTPADEALLDSAAAPIVIMDAVDRQRTAASVAPGVGTLGFMLPNTPLHHLMLQRLGRPIVLTSGNLSDEPQCIDNDEARLRLRNIADYVLLHDRDVVRRVDDSVVRVVAGAPRILRRARGHAPAPLALPEGFGAAPAVLAMGAELKNTFCLTSHGHAVLSHHMGDLEDAHANADYRRSLAQYLHLFEHSPRMIAIDAHPDYLSSKAGRALAAERELPVVEIHHHHAHLAACMAENGVPLGTRPILGIVLDGMGYGADGTLWGGEFLLADYRGCRRMATIRPVAMPGGVQSIREPWRNTYAQLIAAMGWARFARDFGKLDLHAFLAARPRETLDRMMALGINSPLASSCGRLFDAVAAAAGICRERIAYEGQAAIEFEALVDERTMSSEAETLAYPFSIGRLAGSDLRSVEPLGMWEALLRDLALQTPVPVIAARFHKGLAMVIAQMLAELAQDHGGHEPVGTVALSGGVFQNRILLEQVVSRLERLGFNVLTHRKVPSNDGGLALGQAAVAAAQLIEQRPLSH